MIMTNVMIITKEPPPPTTPQEEKKYEKKKTKVKKQDQTKNCPKNKKNNKTAPRNSTHGSSGVSCTGSSVKAGSKCSRSRSERMRGLYGGVICFCSSWSQSMVRKNGWDWMSENPFSEWQPRRSAGFCRNEVGRSCIPPSSKHKFWCSCSRRVHASDGNASAMHQTWSWNVSA